MLDHRIRLRHLHCFLETARLGSLSAAATALNITQPAASKTIRELEGILDRPLFDRSSKRLRLTDTGRVFQQHIGAGMIELSRAQELIQKTPKTRTRVRVGTLPTASTVLVPRAALRFKDAFPDCLVRISTGPNWLMMSQLREGALDMVVGRMATSQTMEGLSFRQLYSELIGVVVRPGHPLLGLKDPAGHLGQFPLMLPPSGAVIAPLVRSFLTRHGVPSHLPAFENVSLSFGRAVVQGSDVVWTISYGVVRTEVEAGTLCWVPLGEALLGGPVGVSMRDDGILTPEQRGLLAALEDVAAEAAPDMAPPLL